jgi:hypothetical protein
MMQGSPIPEAFWRGVFKTSVSALALGCTFSLLNQRRLATAPAKAPLNALAAAKSEDTVEEALIELLVAVDDEARQKKAMLKLAVRGSIAAVVRHASFNSSNERTAKISSLALKLIVKTCGDAEGQTALYHAGGYMKLLKLLAAAHSAGNNRLMDEAAEALGIMTEVDPNEVVLPHDVPAGSEGTAALGAAKTTVQMLRTLDPAARPGFLVHVANIFANLTMLNAGAVAVATGVDGRSGVSYLFALLDPRGNQLIIEHASRALCWITMHTNVAHKEFATQENVQTLVNLLEGASTPNTLSNVMNVITSFCGLKSQPEVRALFFKLLQENGGGELLIRTWCRASEKETRDQAEMVVGILAKLPLTRDYIMASVEMSRSMLMERRARDEEAKRKDQQQQQQQQMFQQMMMGGGGPGGMPPGMGGEEYWRADCARWRRVGRRGLVIGAAHPRQPNALVPDYLLFSITQLRHARRLRATHCSRFAIVQSRCVPGVATHRA